jgi:ABC-type lipoprotein release transport system permease subunit
VVGAVIGCAIGYGLVLALGQVGIDFGYAANMGEMTAMMGSRLYPSVQPSTVLLSGVAVTVIAALASLYPAWQASRKEPAAALHHI